jgi:hypothetical protein
MPETTGWKVLADCHLADRHYGAGRFHPAKERALGLRGVAAGKLVEAHPRRYTADAKSFGQDARNNRLEAGSTRQKSERWV